ncbi:MAG: tetratricopeptide repeat protein [Deltaproteobacteria bacterium]|nr:tetratricopeptide repeat protein [Deltaproteobacteria bacterium]
MAGLLYLARGYELRGEFSSAVESYKKALFLDPADYRAMNNIASLYIRISSPERSIAYLEECVKLKGDYIPALVNLGIAKAETGKTQEAESSFLKALSFDGSNREALFNIAVLYEKTLEFEKARGYYERLGSLGDPKGAKALERLEGRR